MQTHLQHRNQAYPHYKYDDQYAKNLDTQPPTVDVDAERIATLAQLLWSDVNKALLPIIGQLGVTALYKHSLHLTSIEHPWLLSIFEEAQQSDVLSAFQKVISHQSGMQVKAALTAWFRHFRQLFSDLIGPPMAERLLLPALKNSYFSSST